MKIGLTGASGFLGTEVIRQAAIRGDQVVAYSRDLSRPIPGVERIEAIGSATDVSGLDAFIHLAGESIFGLWTKTKREKILQSRVEGTKTIVAALQRAAQPPKTLVSASGAGFYGNRGEEPLDEDAAPGTSGFLQEVSAAWEKEAEKASALGVRVVCLRITLVLGKGGALELMKPVFQFGLGGKLGSGRQWMPWIQLADVVGLMFHAIDHPEISGPLNAAAPNATRFGEFTDALGKVLQRPAVMQVPGPLIKMALQEQSSLILDSQMVIPKKALETGYQFRYPDVTSALEASLDSAPSETA